MSGSWTSDFFKRNRECVAARLKGGLVVIAGNTMVQRCNDMAQPFAQESNMWYLSGINHPDWRLIYDGTRQHCWLVRPEVDEVKRVFDGTIDDESALRISGANEIVGWSEQESILRQLSRRHSTVYTLDPKRAASAFGLATNPALVDNHAVLSRIFHTVSDVSLEIANERAIKKPLEIDAIRRAVELTVKSFQDVRSRLEEFRYEYEIEAEFCYRFRKNGAFHAYDPIVASGRNACTLHYVDNNQKRQAYSSVLIDIGAELNGYCADITRSYAWGKPTKRLVQVHQALELAHHEIIAGIEPKMPIADYLRMVDGTMKRCMIDLGLLIDDRDAGYRQYFPHSVTHGLGVDVHDSLGDWRTLEPGMVITVEPGIYINDESIGLRIEDDVLITKDGVDNLSAKLSTSLAD